MTQSSLVQALAVSFGLVLSVSSCASLPRSPEAHEATATNPSSSPAVAADVANPALPAVADASVQAPVPVGAQAPAPAAALADDGQAAADETDSEDGDLDDEGEPSEAEEATAVDPSSAPGIPGKRYTADLDDAEIERRLKTAPESLGSISIGFADAGRLVNGVPFPDGPNWVVVDPHGSWATAETIRYTVEVLEAMAAYDQAEGYPVARMRVNHLSRPEGGWQRPHKSHQSGRDVDLAFYYTPGGPDRGAKARKDNFDLRRNWALLRAIVTMTDVQMVLADKKIQKRLYDYALSVGEDRAWLDSLFHGGKNALVKHAPRHKDHYHVRFFNGRAQELGRRVQPLLPKSRPEMNVAVHRIRKGDNIGALARRYGTTTKAIMKANHLKSHLVRVGRVITIPSARRCIECPIPPEVIVPARRMPPSTPAMFARLVPPQRAPEPIRAATQAAAAATIATDAASAPAPAAASVPEGGAAGGAVPAAGAE